MDFALDIGIYSVLKHTDFKIDYALKFADFVLGFETGLASSYLSSAQLLLIYLIIFMFVLYIDTFDIV